jgi:hypothetical protein
MIKADIAGNTVPASCRHDGMVTEGGVLLSHTLPVRVSVEWDGTRHVAKFVRFATFSGGTVSLAIPAGHLGWKDFINRVSEQKNEEKPLLVRGHAARFFFLN